MATCKRQNGKQREVLVHIIFYLIIRQKQVASLNWLYLCHVTVAGDGGGVTVGDGVFDISRGLYPASDFVLKIVPGACATACGVGVVLW